MIIWNRVTVKWRKIKGFNTEGKFKITTWFILFIPVYRREVLIN